MVLALVPNHERVHPAEAIETGRSPPGVGRQENLRVGIRREQSTISRQIVFELTIIVDLAVVTDPVATGGIRHRLCATAKIDDAQSRVPEAAATEFSSPTAIGSAMLEPTDGAVECVGRNRPCGVENRGYPTHSRGARDRASRRLERLPSHRSSTSWHPSRLVAHCSWSSAPKSVQLP